VTEGSIGMHAILAFPVMLLVTMASVFLATCMHPTKTVVLF